MLFTDTLNDVNGVSRFIRNVGHQAFLAGKSLRLVTSTRFAPPPIPQGKGAGGGEEARGVGGRSAVPELGADGQPTYIHNLDPIYARPMPGYPQLEIVVPKRGRLRALAREIRPDVIHVSTPGPVGLAGRAIARRMGVPLVGTYHTDFPAYVEHLFNEPAFTLGCTAYMKWFYRPFARLFTRSEEYAGALEAMGYPRVNVVRLLPGIDTGVFSTRYRDETGALWRSLRAEGLDVRDGSAKALYVGRVSVEKNLPLLTRVWPGVRAACAARGVDAQLLVVGDGPYRVRMSEELAGRGVVFLGFRHGEELSRIYATSGVFVFPSTTDTLGQVVMEAQCAGLPVIVTDKGGPSEVVSEGRTGFVLPDEGADGTWIETIAGLLCDEGRRRNMGLAGAELMSFFTIENSFKHFWSVHEEVGWLKRLVNQSPVRADRAEWLSVLRAEVDRCLKAESGSERFVGSEEEWVWDDPSVHEHLRRYIKTEFRYVETSVLASMCDDGLWVELVTAGRSDLVSRIELVLVALMVYAHMTQPKSRGYGPVDAYVCASKVIVVWCRSKPDCVREAVQRLLLEYAERDGSSSQTPIAALISEIELGRRRDRSDNTDNRADYGESDAMRSMVTAGLGAKWADIREAYMLSDVWMGILGSTFPLLLERCRARGESIEG